MNKLFKRTTAFVLMVCLLSALAVPAVLAAPAADEYVYDFRMDKTDLTWTYDGTTYTFGQSNFPHTNGAQVKALDAAYANGDLNWNFPHTSKVGGEGDKPYVDGLAADPLTYKNHASDISQFGGEKYSSAGNFASWDGIKYQPYSGGDATGGWLAITLKAPAAGVYDVSMEYTTGSTDATTADFYLIPYTDTLKAQVANDVATYNAYIDTLTAEGATANKLNKSSIQFQKGSWVKGNIAEFSQVTITGEYDEYLFIIRGHVAGRPVYVDALTFAKPGEKEGGAVPEADGSYVYNFAALADINNYKWMNDTTETSYAGRALPDSNVTALNTFLNLYEDGKLNWSYEAILTNSKVATADRDAIFKYTSGDSASLVSSTVGESTEYGIRFKSGNANGSWMALKIKAPAVGTYDVTFVHQDVGSSGAKNGGLYIIPAFTYTDSDDFNAKINAAITAGTGKLPNTVSYADAKANGVQGDMGQITLTDVSATEYYAVFTVGDNLRAYLQGLKFAPVQGQDPVAAIGETTYLTIAGAVEAAQAGDTIKLLADYVGSIDAATGVSIDLNGNTWTVSEYVAAGANEYVIDSVGGGSLKAGNVVLHGANNEYLALAEDGGYSLAKYELTVDAQTETSPTNAAATRFWFKLDLADADLDKIAAGETGLTIGVELDWGQEAPLAVTFDNGQGAEAFAAAWAAAYKAGTNVWLYADIKGLSGLENDLTVKPILKSAGSTLYNGTITYTVC